MVTRFRVLIFVCLGAVIPTISSASPVLLAEFGGGGGASTCCPLPPALTTPGMALALMINWTGFDGEHSPMGLEADAVLADPTRLFKTGETGTIDFTRDTSPDFDEFVALLTNGQPKSISQAHLLVVENGLVNGKPYVGGVGTGPQQQVAALTGADIDLVRLIVLETVAELDGGAYEVFSLIRWQVYDEVEDPLPAPEPSTILLLGGGLAAMVKRRATIQGRVRVPPRE